MKTLHTPGPWHFDASDMNVYTDAKYSGIATIHRKVKIVGVDNLEVSGLSIQTKANGALIAAAPELLEALVNLVNANPNDNSWNYPAALAKGNELIKRIGNSVEIKATQS
jgi:hypothetical protein